jgi:hypothetical protein
VLCSRSINSDSRAGPRRRKSWLTSQKLARRAGFELRWLLKRDLETVPQTTKVFATREEPDPASRPRLVIHFDPPPIYTYCTAQTASIGLRAVDRFERDA